ncbi:MAG: hypothetical protein QCI82_05545, partial [Candidatus Thermoplasmatota archaeon]|nr:hypothetical protein [Candidatus Thermoplasmatota archaeon]
MVQGNYKIRVKQGDVEIEVEGDKGFVIQTYTDARSMIWKEPVKKAEKPLAAVSVEKKTIPTIEPVKAEPKKRGRKPSKAVEKVKEPVVKAEPKKRGRKPSKAVKKVKEPVVKAEPKKRGRKPSKAVKKV